MHLNELKALHVSEVAKQAEELGIENIGRMRKQELMFAIIKNAPKPVNKCLPTGYSKSCPMALAFAQPRYQLHRQHRRHLHQPQPSAPL